MNDAAAMQNARMVPAYVNRGLSLVGGEGVYLQDPMGMRYLDLMSSYGTANFGYRHPILTECFEQQLRRLVCLHGSFANDTRAEAAQELLARCAGGLARVSFTNSGSEANEAALKFATLATGKKKFVACRGGYHGKTLGALSATEGTRHRGSFEPLIWDFRFPAYNDAAALSEAVDNATAALILEPIQGESGIHPAAPGFLRRAAEICRASGALLILDEVQTGTGRTGHFLASHAEGITADIVTLGKGLAGGIPIGVTMVSARVAESIPRGAHTSTFGGNPLAAAGILAVLKLLDQPCLNHILEVGEYCTGALRCLDSRFVGEIRGRGLMIGFEVAHSRDLVLKALQKEHVLAIPAGENVVRLLPPYIIEKAHLDIFLEKLRRILASPLFTGAQPCAAS